MAKNAQNNAEQSVKDCKNSKAENNAQSNVKSENKAKMQNKK